MTWVRDRGLPEQSRRVDLSALRGGCSGGTDGVTVPMGGVGGGAIQLVSRTHIKVLGSGAINAGGQGALGRTNAGLVFPGGHGGGSGGGIVLEAPDILISGSTAAVAANGGGGSADCDAGRGEDGHASAVAAKGGTCAGDATRGDGGKGGSGSFTTPTPGGGFSPGSDTYHAGGGGAAVGVIRFDTATSSTGLTVSGGAVVSGVSSQNAVRKR